MPSTTSDGPVGTPAGRRAFRPQVTRLEDRTTPADITIAGTTAFVDLNVASEDVTFSTSSSGVIEIASTGGLTQGGSPVSPPFSISGVNEVVVTDSALGTRVLFANSKVAYTAAYFVTLDDSPDVVDFFGTSSFGDNNLTVDTARNVRVFGTVTSNTGNINLSANQQATPTSGFFVGISLGSGSITSTAGTVTLTGRGGNDPDGVAYGVELYDAEGGPSSVSGHTVVITGTGGASSGSSNYGVLIDAASTVTGGNGAVVVTGTGGGIVSGGGNNIGVVVSSSAVISSGGGGAVVVTGTGGDGGGGNYGVWVTDAGIINSGGAGAVVVTGTGGAGGSVTATNNYGVLVNAAGTVTSSGGAVVVTGTGGTGDGGNNHGVYLSDPDTVVSSGGNGAVVITGVGGGGGQSGGDIGVVVDFLAVVTAGGTGAVDISGIGGAGDGGNNLGVLVGGEGAVTSGGGDVSVNGTGGSGDGLFNVGVLVNFLSTVTSGGGAVSVTGTGGAGDGGSNYGVMANASGTVTSGGGDVSVTGTGGSDSFGVNVSNGGLVTSGGTAGVTITTNSLNVLSAIEQEGTILASGSGTGTVTIRPLTAGTLIDLGGADVLSGSPLTLGLTDAELDRVFAGTLIIGSSAAGSLNVTALSRSTATDLQLISGAAITTFVSGGLNTGGGTLTLTPGTVFAPLAPGTEATASIVDFTAGSVLQLNIVGTVPDTQYIRLGVAGALDLTGVSLLLSGGYVPVVGDTFTIVSASSLTGTFAGLPNGAVLTFNGVSLHIFYGSFSGGSDVTLVVNRPPTGVSAGGPYAIAEGSGLTVSAPAATDPDGDALTYTWDVNGDGEFSDEAGGTVTDGGRTVTFTPAQLAALGLTDGPLTLNTLAVRVSDGLTGGTVTAFGTLTVNNVAPTITGLNVPAAGQFGRPVMSSATATDPAGPLDPLAFAWVVTFDGAEVASGIGPTFTFTPTASGVYTVTVSVSDGDGGLATASAAVVVPPVLDPAALVVSDAGVVRVFAADGSTRDLEPFHGFLGDLSVALADLNGDGLPEVVVGAGAGGGPHVMVFDGATGGELASFFAYAPNFTGGVYVAASGDGRIVTGAGAFGGPHVKVFDLTGRELAGFFAYDPVFNGGVRVALGDVTGDGVADIVTGAGPGAAPHVKVFDGTSLAEVLSFFALTPSFTGGVYVAATDGLLAAGSGTWGGPQVQVFDAAGAERQSFFAYPTSFVGGVRVAFADIDGDGREDLVTAPGLGGGLPVRALRLSDLGEVTSFFPFDPFDPLGVFVG